MAAVVVVVAAMPDTKAFTGGRLAQAKADGKAVGKDGKPEIVLTLAPVDLATAGPQRR